MQPRANVRFMLFYRMASTAWTDFHKVGASIEYDTTAPREEPCDAYYESAFRCVIFSGLTLEALIYDFAARHLGDAYVEAHIDKLDLASKWILVPRLVSGAELPKDSREFMLLRRLVKLRNDAVHSKSEPLDLVHTKSEDIIDRLKFNDLELKRGVDDSFAAVRSAGDWLLAVSNDGFVSLFTQLWRADDEPNPG